MLAKDGRVKILDFGLARQSRTPASSRKATGEEETVAPADETKHLTSEGAVLGTASYMSPEQTLGKEVDYRSDQFSFGLILHEMASGKQAFARNSSVETMAAIVRDEPSAIEEKIPAPLKWIIDRCLHKEPEQRYESTRDLFHELKNLREHFSEAYSSSGVLAAVPGKARPLRWRLLAGVAAGCLIAGGSGCHADDADRAGSLEASAIHPSRQTPGIPFGLPTEKPSRTPQRSTGFIRYSCAISTRPLPFS